MTATEDDMKTNTTSKKNSMIFLCLAIMICAIVVDVIVQNKTPSAGAANSTAVRVETGSSVVVQKASDWQSLFLFVPC